MWLCVCVPVLGMIRRERVRESCTVTEGLVSRSYADRHSRSTILVNGERETGYPRVAIPRQLWFGTRWSRSRWASISPLQYLLCSNSPHCFSLLRRRRFAKFFKVTFDPACSKLSMMNKNGLDIVVINLFISLFIKNILSQVMRNKLEKN